MTRENKIYITANELGELLGISSSHAYKMIRKMNLELEKKGYFVISGKVPRAYFFERWYCGSQKEGVQA